MERTTNRPTLLILGDAVAPTGFARVIESVFRPLARDYDLVQLGTNFSGDPHDWPWPVYPANPGGSGDTWGVGRLPEVVERIRPDLVFAINDAWILRDYMPYLASLRDRLPFVAYVPVDAGPVVPEMLAPLGAARRLVAYTEFGRRELAASLTELARRHPGFVAPPLSVIPHGVDSEVFHPAPGDLEELLGSRRAAAKRELLGDRPGIEDSFLVLNANRNQPRKRIDLTLKGFARFAEGKPANVKLYLHMGAKDMGWDVLALARLLGIEERIIMAPNPEGGPGARMPFHEPAALNRIYNACDVGVNTAFGEGWGLVAMEHAAAGAAQIQPGHSACGEIWKGAARLLEPVASLTHPHYLTEEQIVSPEDLADALEELYADPALLADLSRKAYRRATREEYRWETISRRWDRLFREVLEERAGIESRLAGPEAPALWVPSKTLAGASPGGSREAAVACGPSR